MTKQFNTITINFRGGIISTGELQEVLDIAASVQVSGVRFGLRQQMILDIPVKNYQQFALLCMEKQVRYCTEGEESPNIISTYPGVNIFMPESWLSEGTYKDVFEMFDFTPHLKINICEGEQSFVPLLTGNLNWIASPIPHFWSLFIRFPKTNKLYRWPEYVYTNEIGRLSKLLEEIISSQQADYYGNSNADGYALYQSVSRGITYISRPLQGEITLPSFRLAYYEGFNRHGNNYWLGVYRRDQTFTVKFLQDICSICRQTKVGELYATTWKSLIIKGIEPVHRPLWDFVLGKHRINVRHAANELNWYIGDNDEDGLILKRHIIRYFDKEDVRTYGLCFSISNRLASGVFGSVIIRNRQDKASRLKSFDRFDILYTAGFNPNSSDLIIFRENVKKDDLGPYLVSLCKQFYETESTPEILLAEAEETHGHEAGQSPFPSIYQCRHCLTVYDEVAGIPGHFAPGTSFADLPEGYTCELCEAPKADFMSVLEPTQLMEA